MFFFDGKQLDVSLYDAVPVVLLRVFSGRRLLKNLDKLVLIDRWFPVLFCTIGLTVTKSKYLWAIAYFGASIARNLECQLRLVKSK